MKFWTYTEVSTKVITDLDLQDQIFVTTDEMIGYTNEGVKEAAAEILKINEDYFLTKYLMPLSQGEDEYDFPDNIYATKIRGIQYANGTIIYPVKRIRDKDKFEAIAVGNQFGQADDYSYYITNPAPGEGKVVLIPPAREDAVVPPSTPVFAPMTMWYIRDAKRIPIVGEYIEKYDEILPTAVNTGTNVITVAQSYVTGDQVKLSSTLTLPSPLITGTVYYAIRLTATTIKLATSRVNALAGTAIVLGTTGTGVISIAIAATQTIIDNTLIDVPQFAEFVMQFMKCRCLEKEGDPRLSGAAVTLERLRKQMVDSLTQAVPDNDDMIQADFSAYDDMSVRGYY